MLIDRSFGWLCGTHNNTLHHHHHHHHHRYSCSILDAMRQARIASQVVLFQQRVSGHAGTGDATAPVDAAAAASPHASSPPAVVSNHQAFSVPELLYLATVGGAQAIGLDVSDLHGYMDGWMDDISRVLGYSYSY